MTQRARGARLARTTRIASWIGTWPRERRFEHRTNGRRRASSDTRKEDGVGRYITSIFGNISVFLCWSESRWFILTLLLSVGFDRGGLAGGPWRTKRRRWRVFFAPENRRRHRQTGTSALSDRYSKPPRESTFHCFETRVTVRKKNNAHVVSGRGGNFSGFFRDVKRNIRWRSQRPVVDAELIFRFLFHAKHAWIVNRFSSTKYTRVY